MCFRGTVVGAEKKITKRWDLGAEWIVWLSLSSALKPLVLCVNNCNLDLTNGFMRASYKCHLRFI